MEFPKYGACSPWTMVQEDRVRQCLLVYGSSLRATDLTESKNVRLPIVASQRPVSLLFLTRWCLYKTHRLSYSHELTHQISGWITMHISFGSREEYVVGLQIIQTLKLNCQQRRQKIILENITLKLRMKREKYMLSATLMFIQ